MHTIAISYVTSESFNFIRDIDLILIMARSTRCSGNPPFRVKLDQLDKHPEPAA